MEHQARMLDRLADLEAQVRSFTERLRAGEKRRAVNHPQQVRMVRTLAAGGVTYPAWPANELPAVFVDQYYGSYYTGYYFGFRNRSAETQVKIVSPIWIPEKLVFPVMRSERGYYFPVKIPLIKGVVNEVGGIAADTVGTITAWVEGEDSGTTLEAAYNWFHQGVTLQNAKQVLVEFFPDEMQYVIVDWEC